ncbi:hypothetical protein [Gemmatimonas sp.]|jgi:hypothetical protein|uniref:hypothetical protein n=1 Tax=Gemmatimonas sp. TaxID=1962908 RepID=UPI0037BEE38B
MPTTAPAGTTRRGSAKQSPLNHRERALVEALLDGALAFDLITGPKLEQAACILAVWRDTTAALSKQIRETRGAGAPAGRRPIPRFALRTLTLRGWLLVEDTAADGTRAIRLTERAFSGVGQPEGAYAVYVVAHREGHTARTLTNAQREARAMAWSPVRSKREAAAAALVRAQAAYRDAREPSGAPDQHQRG